MPLVCLGLSHHTAPVEVRERHAFPPQKMGEALIALRDYEAVREALMLQTCGRLEIYAELEDYEIGVRQLKAFLENFRHGDVSDMESYMYTLLGTQAIEHLIRVSTGLDSMLIGEAEILGQVKDAYVQAQRAHSLGKTLHTLFRSALEAGKSARTHTAISGDSTSIAGAAIAYATQHVGPLSGKNVLVIGAGKMGALAARRLKVEGAGEIVVLNRSQERARAVAAELGASVRAAEPPRLAEALVAADVVVTSTGASHFILTAAKRWRRGRIARCSSSTSRFRATSIPKSRRSPASAWSTSTASRARSTGRSRSAVKRSRWSKRSSPSTSSVSASGISRASRSR